MTPPNEQRPILGLSIGVMGCCATAVGYTLQKIAHIRTARAKLDSPNEHFTYWKRVEFIVGCVLLVAASCSAAVTFTMVSQSELAPLGAVTLAVQVALSFCLLQEPFTWIDGLAVFLMTIGTTLAIGNAKSANQQMSVDSIVFLFMRPVSIISGVGVSVVIMTLASFVAAVGRKHGAALPAGTANLDALSRSVIAGLLGGCTTTLGKAVASLLILPAYRRDVASLGRIEPWLCASALAIVMTYQMRYLNSGLGRYDSMRVIP